ncbi:E3 ubiquitin-protein ligase PRT6 [Gastrolobium bilobum]|uniref:E3 ubiquitin-protein ligase PRT6 n=2 Tax=Gastrolobium bilobum TaxID=150636 RepID=UPI002AB19DB2|nr:E3 ubiquitin-protein ligase PRT6 [Gastrolobium bilobum]
MADKMEIDLPSDSQPLKSRDRIVRRLVQFGVPEEQLDQPGLVDFVKDKRDLIPDLVSVILPPDVEVAEALQDSKLGSKKTPLGVTMKKRFHESMVWLQWLMFEGDPSAALRGLSKMSVGQRGVCGAVWGHNDIAYRCRTCEHDPTCAICVPCFENGDHKGHDYFVIYTGGGCCDCGDVTAWKREGFCLKHKGAEQIQPLPEEFANSIAPVLGSLFTCWKHKLVSASDSITERKKAANELTFSVVDMLLEFCKHSESLLSFIAKSLFSSTGLLGILVRSERFLTDVVVKKLHELLLKLLGEPIFKYEFAKVFLTYYPSVINEAIKECSDHPLKRYPLLSTFSVQILTVPTLTPRLVKEINLLTMLLGCLESIFISCAEDGRLQVSRWVNLYETTIRVVEDIRFVMSHVVVPKYVTNDQQDISRTWMRLISFVQGMNPQKRETGQHIEEENENVHLPFVLGHSIANIHSLLVDGAFSDSSKGEMDDENVWSSNKNESDDGDNLRRAKVGRLSQDSSTCNVTCRNSVFASSKVLEIKSDASSQLLLPRSVSWLIYECLRAIENWWGVENTPGVLPKILAPNNDSVYDDNFSAFKRTISNFRRGKYTFGRLASSREDHGNKCSEYCIDDLEIGKNAGKDGKLKTDGEIDSENTCIRPSFDDSAMDEDFPVESDCLHFLSLPDWPQIVYDVSSQDISVHTPLHRLLSMLLTKALRRYFCESEVPDVTDVCSTNSLSTIYTDFFGHALRGSHPNGFSAFIMEHPMRIRVFCAEVHAGMWRKNGDAALLSCEWYRSVRWSEQGLELDLFLLQCCAALAPEDQYVSRILERFGLSNYLSLNLERSSEYEPVLVQEMLTLIIQIIKERRFCGLSTAESLKRELIYKLSIGDTTHSLLLKSLPRDLSKFEQLQDILDTVAVYSNPSGFNQGMYSLRWPLWKELDLYHPRWNSKDLQVAEERYLRFCSVSALTSQVPQWTKIHPPLKGIARIATCKVVLQFIRAVLYYAVFTFKSAESRAPDSVLIPALHLLSLSLDICFQQKGSSENTCHDVAQIPIIAFSGEIIDENSSYDGELSLLSLLVLLMERHRKENEDNFVQPGGCSLSTLIESLLKKFAEIDDRCMIKLQNLAPEVVGHVSEIVPTRDSSVSLSASDSEKRKAKARERQAAIMEKMRAQQTKFLASIDSTVDDGSQLGHEGDLDTEHDAEESKQIVCSLCHDHSSKYPISIFILLQKSKLVSSVDRGPPSWAQLRQSDKEHMPIINTKETDTLAMNWNSGSTSSSHLTQLVQNAANELASSGQPGEVNLFLRYVKNQFPVLGNFQLTDTCYEEKERTPYTFETLERGMYFCIRDEVHDLMLSSDLMNEDEKVPTAGGNPNNIIDTGSVLLGKYTADLVREMSENSSASENACGENASVESTSQHPAYDGFGPTDCDGVHLSSCGHAAHQGCLDRYLSSLKERYVRRIVFEGGHIVDPDQGEFLCPVCRRLVNCVLPTLPGELQKPLKQSIVLSTGSIPTAAPIAKLSEVTHSLHLQQALKLLQSAANAVGKDKFLKAIPLHHIDRTRPNLENFSQVLSKMYFPGKQDKLSTFARLNHSILMWDSLKYSLTSMEIAARCGRTTLTPNFALSAMYEELRSSTGFILSLLLKLVQKARSKNSLHVLQRFRGVQLFAESICSGVSLNYANNDVSGRGDMLTILKHIEKDLSNTDICFWSQASDPVLAHDPFSTLMWVLFCLPYPFLSCEESLLSLVHLFYIVAVTQAIILYYEKSQDKSSSKSSFSDCLITDIYKVMGESGCALQYFVSNYFDPGVDIKDAIRKFTFPYLRRCALLWKLLYSSIPAPFCDGEYMLDRSWNVLNDTMDRANIDMFEVTKIQELENMFKIPPLDAVLKDELSRSSVSIWCRHFCKEIELQGIQRHMHITPAVPFELMRLPNVYQDLLQRCIKQRCPECKTLLDEPALCLLCGKLCSPSWKPCCSKSGCQTHSGTCGAGTGVFLLIRRTTILLQRSARQAPWPSPYLDAFGEEDFEMNRGKPLYLNEERYAALTYMVASHGLDRSSKVLGQTTIGSFFLV